MVDSIEVLNGQTMAYTFYAIAIIILVLWFGIKITSEGNVGMIKDKYFSILVVLLVVLGVSLHIATGLTIPWVSTDLNRNEITAHNVFNISVADHKFTLPQEKMKAKVGDYVMFDVTSGDLTYGFGIFRQDNTMVCQMQVVPGHRNDLMWQFAKPGIYYIRSTEYSGPKGNGMIVENAIEIYE
ncbi:MAG: cytochrome C oxidase subunit II [Bacteroidota bacterium]